MSKRARVAGPTISLAMIVKNEEARLARCLGSVRDLAHELVVVDTGSIDRTRRLARDLGARVHQTRWTDDFSEARNTSLSLCRGEWLLVLDADEHIAPADHEQIRQITARPDVDAVEFIQANYRGNARSPLWRPVGQRTPESLHFAGYIPVPTVRLFRNGKGYCFRDRIHETVIESVLELGGRACCSGLLIHHYGSPPSASAEKADLYRRLVRMKARENPHDPKAQWELADLYMSQGKLVEAEEALRLASTLGSSFLPAFCTMAQLMIKQQRFDEARRLLSTLMETNVDVPLGVVELLVTAHLHCGDLREAEALVAQILKKEPSRPITRLWAGVIAEELGQLSRAEAHYRFLALNGHEVPETMSRYRSYLKRKEATALFRGGDQAKAISTLKAALAEDPDDYLVYHLFSLFSAKLGQLAEAKQMNQFAARVAPFSRLVAQTAVELDPQLGIDDAAWDEDAPAIPGADSLVRS